MKSTSSKFFLVFTAALFALGLGAAEPSPTELQNALTEARAQLDALKQKYSDQHPAVKELKARIAALERQGAQEKALSSDKPKYVSIDFAGGPLRNLVDQLSKIEGVSVSIISSNAADLDTPLPPFSLRNTNVMAIVHVLSQLLTARQFDLAPMPVDANSIVAVLSPRPAARTPAPRPPPPTMFDSFPLETYLGAHSIDDIVGAIREGWELDPAHERDALRLKFHPATGILLVSGPPDAILIASKVISQLKGSFDKDSKSNPRPLQPATEAPKH